VVAPAFAASIVAGITFSESSAAIRLSSSSAFSTPGSSRSAFQRSRASMRSRSTSGSGFMIPPSASAVSGESSVSV